MLHENHCLFDLQNSVTFILRIIKFDISYYLINEEQHGVTGKLQPIDLLIGQRVRIARIEKGLTQVDLAEALGVTFQQVQKYETGKNRIAASRLIDIARALQMDITALLPTTEMRPPHPPVLSKQSAQLLRDFESIADLKLRESVLSIVRKVASDSMARASQPAPSLRTHYKRRA